MRVNNMLAPMILAVLVLVGSSAVPATAQTAEFVKKFSDWSTYKYDGDGKKLCFAITRPKDAEPKSVARSDIFLYVTNWTNDKVVEEVSIKLGYETADGTDVTVTVGPQRFTLFTSGDKAFVQSPEDERKLVDAMKRGNTLTVSAKTEKGVATTDSYSLSGITAAINAASSSCS